MQSDRDARIRERAYQIWLSEGRVEGRHQEHWERAEREIEEEDKRVGETGQPTAAPRTTRAPAGGEAPRPSVSRARSKTAAEAPSPSASRALRNGAAANTTRARKPAAEKPRN